MTHLNFNDRKKRRKVLNQNKNKKTLSVSERIANIHQRALKMQKDTKSNLVSTKVSLRRIQRKVGKTSDVSRPTIGGSMRTGGKLNKWLIHVKAHKKKNPKHSHKQALIAAKKTYKR